MSSRRRNIASSPAIRKGERGSQNVAVPVELARLACLWIQDPVDMVRIARNECQISPSGLVRFRPALLPIPQRTEGDVIAGGKFLLGQIQGTPDDFRLWCSPHPLDIGFGERLCIAIRTCSGPIPNPVRDQLAGGDGVPRRESGAVEHGRR